MLPTSLSISEHFLFLSEPVTTFEGYEYFHFNNQHVDVKPIPVQPDAMDGLVTSMAEMVITRPKPVVIKVEEQEEINVEPLAQINVEEPEELGPRVRKMSARMQEWVDQYGKESTTRRGHGFTKKRK